MCHFQRGKIMVYSISEARELVIKAGLALSASGLIARTWGNISARISDQQFVITPSGRSYASLTPADIVTVSIADGSYEGSVLPSSEKWIHLEAYRLRPDVSFVIHTHQAFASCLSTLKCDISTADCSEYEQSVLGSCIACASYGAPGSDVLRRAAASAIVSHPSSRSILLQNHGVECMGYDYDDAFCIAHTLEDVSRRRYLSLCHNVLPSEYHFSDEDSLSSCESKDPASYYHIYSADNTLDRSRFPLLFATDPSIRYIIQADSPFIHAISQLHRTLPPYIDDLAMIGGTSISCIRPDAPASVLLSALKNKNAVLLADEGAICTGQNLEDAKAVCIVLEKGCQAALLKKAGQKARPISWISARNERRFYVQQYAKRF